MGIIVNLLIFGVALAVIPVIWFLKRKARLQKEAFLSIMEGVEREQLRIATDLHYNLGPYLSAAKMKILLLEMKLKDQGFEDKEKFHELGVMMDTSVHTIREVSYNLTPPTMKNGLNKALAHFIQGIGDDRVEARYFCRNFETSGNLVVDTGIFRVVRELVLNAVKHAQAQVIRVFVFPDKNGKLNVIVSDNGIGKSPMLQSVKGIGFSNVRNYLKLIDGKFKVSENKKGGLRFKMVFDKNYWK